MKNESTKVARRRAQLTTTRGLALAARWRDSGLSLAAFGRQERVSADVVKYWATKARATSALGKQSGFYVLQPQDEQAAQGDATGADPGQVVVLVVPTTGPALRTTLAAVGLGARR